MEQNRRKDPPIDEQRLSRRAQNPGRPPRRLLHLITEGAVIAALYAALTIAAAALGLSGMAIQVRFSEALCVLSFFTPAAVPGLTVGCLLGNILTGANVWDVVFGTLATLLGAGGGYGLGVLARRASAAGHRRASGVWRSIVPLPTVAANTLIVPPVLIFAYGVPQAYPLVTLLVFIGELIAAWGLGLALLPVLEKTGLFRK